MKKFNYAYLVALLLSLMFWLAILYAFPLLTLLGISTCDAIIISVIAGVIIPAILFCLAYYTPLYKEKR